MTSGPRTTGFPEAGGALALPWILLGTLPTFTLFAVAVVCLGLGFLFALFEQALILFSLSPLLAEAKRRGVEEAIRSALEREEETLLSSKIARGLAQTVGIVAFAIGMVESRPPEVLVVAWSVLAALLFLLFNVAMPFVLAGRAADRILLRGLIPYQRVMRPFHPVARLFHRAATNLLRAHAPPDRETEITADILSAVEEGSREGVLGDTERKMIAGVIDLRGATANQIMTPRTEVVGVPVTATMEEALAVAGQRGLSRLPIYRDSIDDIIGVLYSKDLLPYLLRREAPPPIEKLVRRAFFVPETKSVRELLHEMRVRQVHLAIVLDEYGGTAGVVTIEDILEEIVGEIADEHEEAAAQPVVRGSDGGATVEGGVHIDELNSALGISIPESEEYETVGGLLLSRLGRVPAAGEQVEFGGVRFTVLDADPRRVRRVKVTLQKTG